MAPSLGSEIISYGKIVFGHWSSFLGRFSSARCFDPNSLSIDIVVEGLNMGLPSEGHLDKSGAGSQTLTAAPRVDGFGYKTISLSNFAANLLLDIFDPFCTFDPLVVDLLVTAVVLNLPEEVVQPVQEVRITFVDRPGQRLKGEGLVQKYQLACALLGIEHHAVRQVIDEGVSFAIDHL